MNTGIAKKLEELVGKVVDVFFFEGGIGILCPGPGDRSYTLERIADGCIVLHRYADRRMFLSIDHIAFVEAGK